MNIRKWTVSSLAVALLCPLGQVTASDVYVNSFTNGGIAEARGIGFGNTRVNSYSGAGPGSISRSDAIGRGIRGGYSEVNAASLSQYGGTAQSQARGDAQFGANVRVNGTAATVGGLSRSLAEGSGFGPAWVDSNSIVQSQFGVASGRSRGRGYGPSSVVADSFSDTVRGNANSQVDATAFRGRASAIGRSFNYPAIGIPFGY